MASFNDQAGAASDSKLVLPITGGSSSELANNFPYSAGVGEGKTLRNQCHFLSAFIEAYLVKNRRTRTTLVTCGPRSKK